MSEIKVKNFPDLGRAFQIMKLEDKLLEIAPIGCLAVSIHWALKNKKPMRDIAQMIMDQHNLTPVDVEFIVSLEIISLIKSIYNP